MKPRSEPYYKIRLLLFLLQLIAISLGSKAIASCKSGVNDLGDVAYSSKKAASFEYWRTYVDSNPDMCWAVSEPTNTDIILEKNSESNCRVKPSITFSYFPLDKEMGELMYFSGVLLDKNKPAYLYIDDTKFPLSIIDGANAWAKNSTVDRNIFTTMSTAEVVRIVSVTYDGSVFSDTFNLNGFQNAANLAFEFCKTLQGKL
jgi:hypothetical protein